MPAQHISELIRDYGRLLLSGRHPTKSAKPPDETPFDEGVLAARMGMEKDDNPYRAGHTPTTIGRPGLNLRPKCPRQWISTDANAKGPQ